MFIKPVDVASHSLSGNWQDNSGNLKFSLQSKQARKNLFSSLMVKKSLDYDFRILLRTRKNAFVIAVDDTFEKIHDTWNWIEQNVMSKLEAMEADNSTDDVDNLLVKRFEDLAEEMVSDGLVVESSQSDNIRNILTLHFPTFKDDVLLTHYASNYVNDDGLSTKGRFCISRYTVYFYGNKSDNDSGIFLSLPFKDVTSFDTIYTKGILNPDMLQIVMASKMTYSFVLFFNRKEVVEILTILSDSAMNRLIKGAETSLSSSSEVFAKAGKDMTGDLAVNTGSKLGPLLVNRSRYELDKDHSATFHNEIEEKDFTDQINVQHHDRPSISSSHNGILSSQNTEFLPIQRRSNLSLSEIGNITDLYFQVKNLEFKRIFKLPIEEEILSEEKGCYFHSSVSTFGNMYISKSYITFTSAPSSNSEQKKSRIFESSYEPLLQFLIPYSHIVSVTKQPPTALPSAAKLSAFSLSGYLAISTKNKMEYWISFSSTKNRDKFNDIIFQKIKSIDWKFDDDFMLGTRNGNMRILPSASGYSYTANVKQGAQNEDFLPVDFIGINGIILCPLKVRFPIQTQEWQHDQSDALQIWNGHLNVVGRDVCIVKDLPTLRNLIIQTYGVPEQLRGDFWMLMSGAWYSKPEPSYYSNLFKSCEGKPNPYQEEIEKDVRRSMPEHPAYQDPVGIDALRRVLTSYSFRNPTVGYAQALNMISAIFLLNLQEADAFWLLCNLVERILPDHYTKTLVGSVVDQAVFNLLVQEHLPNLSSHMKKIYMDMGIFSVPWFVCLYLNSVNSSVAMKILDCFFLDGPKFLFWMSLSILKINERKLIEKGRDDDIFVRILKEFFKRLDTPSISEPQENEDLGESMGRPLFVHLMTMAYETFAPQITTEVIEGLRVKTRLQTVHLMENSNRRSQIRTLCEQVSLSYNEVGVLYDQTRRLEFINGEMDEDPNCPQAVGFRAAKQEENKTRDILVEMGGWGMVRNIRKDAIKDNMQKSISLVDFRKIFASISPWRSGTCTSDISDSLKRNKSQNSTDSSIRSETGGLNIPLTDRIFFYCSFQYHFVNQRKAKKDASAVGFNVDLAAMAHVLDIVMKQALQSRLRFLFDLHDIDGDGFLNKEELKSVMDSLLSMFEKSRQGPDKDVKKRQQGENEELYLLAISSFLASALKLGKDDSSSNQARSSFSKKALGDDDEEDIGKSNRNKIENVNSREEEGFKLGFNEFLLAVLSQSIFVEFFERTLTYSEQTSGDIFITKVSKAA